MGRLRGWIEDDRVVVGTLVLLGVVLAMLGLAGRPSRALAGTVIAQYAVWWHLLILVCAASTLLAKRRHPVLTLVVVAALTALDGYLGGGIVIFVVLFDALYTAALLTSAVVRRRIVWAVVAVAVGGPAVMIANGSELREAVVVFLQAVALYGTPLWWASDVRQRTELAELESRRADLERERADLAREVAADAIRIAELDRESAVREERARMARDLHDVVAGHLSAVAIHTEATLASADTSRDRDTLRSRPRGSARGPGGDAVDDPGPAWSARPCRRPRRARPAGRAGGGCAVGWSGGRGRRRRPGSVAGRHRPGGVPHRAGVAHQRRPARTRDTRRGDRRRA